MAYETINSTSMRSIADLMVYTGTTFSGFWPLVLFGLWLIITLGTYFSQQRLSGSGDFISSATSGSLVTLVATFMLSLIPNLINIYVLSVVLMVTLICVWILLSSENIY